MQYKKFYSNLIAAYAVLIIAFQPIVNFTLKLLRFFFVLPFRLDTFFLYFLILIGFLLIVFKFFFKSINIKLVVILLFFLFSFCIVIFYDNFYLPSLLSILSQFILFSIPSIILYSYQKDFLLLKKYLNSIALYLLIYVIFELYIFKSTELSEQYYSMTLSYITYIPAVIYTNNIFKKNESFFLNFPLLFISYILLVILGTRGPILFVLLFFLIKFIISSIKSKNVFKSFLFFASVSVVFIFSFEGILFIISNLFSYFNLSSRILDYFFSNDFLESNTRLQIFSVIFNVIIKNPFFGIGLTNDRLILSLNLFPNQSFVEGLYSHNIFIEILVSYGLFLGLLLIFLFLISFTNLYIKNFKTIYGEILLIFFALSVFPLMTSGSFITYPIFFGLLGLMVNNYLIKK